MRGQVQLHASPADYELRKRLNGVGPPPDEGVRAFEFFYRAAPARGAGVGLAVVNLLVEHSGGKLMVDAGAGQATIFVAVRLRCDIFDYLV
jgi:signal transduction histidine kinase